MYTVTFYSFKGGVGRSMALMNVALELVKKGSRVLVVDFDLEAPGIETFNLPRPESAVPGVVDFVHSYLETAKAPDVSEFVFRSNVPSGSAGELWVMPAGVQDERYSSRLNSINWRTLYAEQRGYLLFEDLKAQWESYIAPDYVLIDSRTGYTDVAGICTRQLPDAVVCLFFPTEQNLNGLRGVVNRIREESTGARQKAIELLFVNSNVPETDDETGDLENRLNRFKAALGYKELAATIHHYNYLSLFSQAIFTLERPRTRLAEEYRNLLSQIRLNPADREGALFALRQILRSFRTRPHRPQRREEPVDLEHRLKEIHLAHSSDGEIVMQLAAVRMRQGKLEECAELLEECIALGTDNPEIFLLRADVAQRLGQKDVALTNAELTLQSDATDVYQVGWAVRWIRSLDITRLVRIDEWPAIAALDDSEVLELCEDLLDTDEKSLPVAESLLRSRNAASNEASRELRTALQLNLIGQGRPAEALSLMNDLRSSPDQLEQREAFNLAMAIWGAEYNICVPLFQRAVDQHEDGAVRSSSPNYAQCLAIAHWAIGNKEGANRWLSTARQRIMSRSGSAFSCWRYFTVDPSRFLNDLDEIERLISGQSIEPKFVKTRQLEADLETAHD